MKSRFPQSRKLILLLGDLILITLTVPVGFYIFFGGYVPYMAVTSYLYILPLILVSAAVVMAINDLLSLERKDLNQVLLSTVVTVFELFIIIMGLSYLFKEYNYSRNALLLSVFFQLPLLLLWKYIFWRFEVAKTKPSNALIIGGQEECKRIIQRLEVYNCLNYRIKHICTNYENGIWQRSISDDIDIVILMPDLALKVKADVMNFCQKIGKQVFLVPGSYEVFCFNAQPEKIDDIPVLRAVYLKPTLEQRILKRLLDLSISGIALGMLCPVIILIAILVKATSTGPIFYRQVRCGKDERQFKIYKFRTMINNAEKNTGPVLASKDDPRITSIGRFLRALRLDELPQLFNVLRGDMSIVGPRPERPFYVEQYKNSILGYTYRHNVKPGITGLAQVCGKYNTTPHDKLIYDLIYIQKISVLTDIVIMFQTIRILVSKDSTSGVDTNNLTVDLAKYSSVK